MAMSPNSVVHLLNVPLENNYKNQIYFANKSEQTNYMISKKKFTFEKLTYQRKDNVIRVPLHIDKLWEVNYVMYQNTDYGNKWFYAFVTKMEYVNDGRTDVYIETDVWQTWFSEVTLKESFVEREHVMNDTVGLHTIPEDLNIGQIVSDYTKADYSFYNESGWYWIIVACNYDPNEDKKYSGIATYADYPQGTCWFAFLIQPLADETGINELSDWIYEVGKGHADDIQEMFVLPYQFISPFEVENGHRLPSNKVKKIQNKTVFSKSVIRKFNDYEAKNNKLYVYPYSFMRVTNNMGSFNDYKIEDFHEMSIEDEGTETDNMTFEVIATPCQNVSGKLRPLHYQGIAENEDESLSVGKFPTLSWSSDSFTNWLTQNSINLGVTAITTAITTATGGFIGGSQMGVKGGFNAGVGNVGGAGNSFVNGLGSIIGGMHMAYMQPNTTRGNANAGDVSFNFNLNKMKFLHMRPKKEYLKTIDDFFTMYGYKVNTVKVPNINGRPKWNYVKTVGVNLDGKAPQDDLTKIRNMFDNGVTFWKNGATIEDYSQNNSI